uniref:Uncharacterized protein n=1 Tax=Anguilla anguilla TaxID=7936 RepID=A0A0E9PUE6_ANGAN
MTNMIKDGLTQASGLPNPYLAHTILLISSSTGSLAAEGRFLSWRTKATIVQEINSYSTGLV